MPSRFSTLLAVFGLINLVHGDGVTCETSDGASPFAEDCEIAIGTIDNANCYKLNPRGSGCQTITTSGSCAISVCIDDSADTVSWSMLGQKIRSASDNLLFTCRSERGYVGGIFQYSDLAATNGDACLPHPDSGPNSYANVEFIHT